MLILSILFYSQLALAAESSASVEECSRKWALEGVSGKNFKIIGLGVSSQVDPKVANDEAKTSAFQDISVQLQSTVQSHSEIKESQSESNFQGQSILTSSIEDLVGLKSLKSGSHLQEKITRCEVFEFNVQAAYEDQSAKLSVIQEKLNQIQEFGNQKKWIDVIREFPTVQTSLKDYSKIIQRADLFKSYLNVPGPGWNERFEKTRMGLKSLDTQARSHLQFIFPKSESQLAKEKEVSGQFDAPIAEVSGAITNAGAQTLEKGAPLSPDSLGIEVTLRVMGTPRQSTTRLGLTLTRKISIVLTDIKSHQKLATSNGLSIVGTSSGGDLEEAKANSDSQVIGALTDAIKNAVPKLLGD